MEDTHHNLPGRLAVDGAQEVAGVLPSERQHQLAALHLGEVTVPATQTDKCQGVMTLTLEHRTMTFMMIVKVIVIIIITIPTTTISMSL